MSKNAHLNEKPKEEFRIDRALHREEVLELLRTIIFMEQTSIKVSSYLRIELSQEIVSSSCHWPG